MSIEPESPMNIRAGKKLCGRNPRQAPLSAAVRNAAVVTRVRWFSKARTNAKLKNATAPMPTTPTARPSRPSTKLTALTVPDDDEHGQDRRLGAVEDERRGGVAAGQRQPVELHALYDHEPGREDLAGELGQRVELEEVVDHTDGADRQPAEQDGSGVVETPGPASCPGTAAVRQQHGGGEPPRIATPPK
jgi:hypothetical protein